MREFTDMEMLDNSIVVAAHPDDENLWFSSILSGVDRIILCFLSVASMPKWTEGRKRSIASYPLPKVTCLELPESEVFWGVDWSRPEFTGYGLRVTQTNLTDAIYRNNFARLKQQLRDHLRGCENVFTHNPWGEYGHVEHVQVYRAVKDLQEELGFRLWFTGYTSNKTALIMSAVLAEGGYRAVMLPTDKPLAEQIAELYKNNDCWTWYDDYAWCDSDVFITEEEPSRQLGKFGSVIPVNFIRIEPTPGPGTESPGMRGKARAAWRKLFGAAQRQK